MQAAERTLTQAAATPLSSRDVFYNLAEIKLAKNQTDEAVLLYQKAADADTSWGKPLFKLGTIAMNKGDKTGRAEGDDAGDRDRSDLAGSRAGEDGHRTAQIRPFSRTLWRAPFDSRSS